MRFQTMGDPSQPAILFFHAMGVTGDSSVPVARCLRDRYFCIMPTATVYCPGETYQGKADELRQLEAFLEENKVEQLELVVASSLGADLATAFLATTAHPVAHVFFDGGQFAQINRGLRAIMTPVVYLAIKSLYWSKGQTLKHILWCDDASIQPYFIAAGQQLTYRNQHRQLADSLENKPFPPLPEDLQKRTFWEFGSVEDHFKYRANVMKAYPHGHFPIFDGYNHMQFQIRQPKAFASMLVSVMEENALPSLSFLRA